MWPMLLDYSETKCLQILRGLELEAYNALVSALRAQGKLSPERLKLLQLARNILHITPERHRAEIRRAANDEKLNTIAFHIDGVDTYGEWAKEGRREVNLLKRKTPQTAYLPFARLVADASKADNAKLPLPASTARVAEPVTCDMLETAEQLAKLESQLLDKSPEDTIPTHTITKANKPESPADSQPRTKRKRRIGRADDPDVPNEPAPPQSSYINNLIKQKQAEKSARAEQAHVQPSPTKRAKKREPKAKIAEAIMLPRSIKTLSPIVKNVTVPSEPNQTIKDVTSQMAVTSGHNRGAQILHQQTVKSPIKVDTESKFQMLLPQTSKSGPAPGTKTLVRITPNNFNTPKIVMVSQTQSLPSNTNKYTNVKLTKENISSFKLGNRGDIVMSPTGPTNPTMVTSTPNKRPRVLSNQIIMSKSPLTPISGAEKGKFITMTSTSKSKPTILGNQLIVSSPIMTSQITGASTFNVSTPNPIYSNVSTPTQSPLITMPVLQNVQLKNIQGKNTVQIVPVSSNSTKVLKNVGTTLGPNPIYLMNKSGSVVVNKANIVTETSDGKSEVKTFQLKSEPAKLSSVVLRKPLTASERKLIKPPARTIKTIKPIAPKVESVTKSSVVQHAPTHADDDIESQISQITQLPQKPGIVAVTTATTALKVTSVTTNPPKTSSTLAVTMTPQARNYGRGAVPVPAATGLVDRKFFKLDVESDDFKILERGDASAELTPTGKVDKYLSSPKFISIEDAVVLFNDTGENRVVISQTDTINSTTPTTVVATTDAQLSPKSKAIKEAVSGDDSTAVESFQLSEIAESLTASTSSSQRMNDQSLESLFNADSEEGKLDGENAGDEMEIDYIEAALPQSGEAMKDVRALLTEMDASGISERQLSDMLASDSTLDN